jgi:hypothetical protein
MALALLFKLKVHSLYVVLQTVCFTQIVITSPSRVYLVDLIHLLFKRSLFNVDMDNEFH